MRWVVFILSCLAGLFAFYSAAFWLWVSATPLTPPERDRVEYNYYFWLGIACASLASAIASLSVALRKRRNPARGVEVPQ